MKVRRKETLDCFYLTKDSVDEFIKWAWDYIRLCDSNGNDLEYNIVKGNKGFWIDWLTCGTKRYFTYDCYYVIEVVDRGYYVELYTNKEFEEEFEVIE